MASSATSFGSQLSVFGEPMRKWAGSVVLAIAVGIAFFLASRLALTMLTKPDGVAVFWPAAGIAAGVLIALGPSARLPVAVGTIIASVPANLLSDHTIWTSIIFALCNAGEAMFVAGLIERYFGSAFSLGRLSNVLGLLVAAIGGSAVAAIGGTVGFVLTDHSTAPVLTIWHHWFTSNTLGNVTFGPLLIGLVSAARDPPPRSEVFEGVVALMALTLLNGLVIFLPREPSATLAVALLLPLLLWLAARCRPVFAAAAAFIVALTIVWTTTFGIGIFGDANFPIADRILAAQASILTVSLCALVLAALFSERRESEARLARSNMMLQREQNNKLMNLEAMAASIAHEVRQPLAAIAMQGATGLRWLGHVPPNVEEARSAFDAVVRASHRTSKVFDSIRSLFTSAGQGQELIDVNEIALGAIRILRAELEAHSVTARADLTPELPLVMGHSGQLQEVILNLAHNAVEAMDAIQDGNRKLRVITQHHDSDAIVVAVEDTGPGIDPKKLDGIFDAFVTTKSHGMGLGLAICRMIIERHGGQISAQSDKKRGGALFQFILPIRPAATSTAAPP